MARRTFLVLLFVSALVLGLLPAAFAAPGSSDPGPAPTAALVDRDGDGISDDLQAELSTASPSDRFDVVVSFSRPSQAAAALRSAGLTATRDLPIINGFAASATAAQIGALARSPGVERIDRDFEVTVVNNEANQDFGTAAARADYALTGAGVGICVADTGVDPDHEQTDKVVGWHDAINGQPDAYDDHGHGTHVAGTAAGDGDGTSSDAATYMGVAPAAPIYATKVLDSNGSGTESQVIAGVDWCANQSGVHVISMSIGTASSSDGQDNLSKAVNNAVTEFGKVAVVAAGNSGDMPYTVGSPGAAEQAITVGAVAEWSGVPGAANHSLGIYLAPWSSRGPTADERIKPDVAAPGHTITSAEANTGTGYSTASGTSMATPFVSGTVALALEADPALTADQVRQHLEGTTQDRGPAGKDNDWGAGLVDGYAFLSQVSGSSGQTVFPTYQRTSGSVADHGLWSWAFEVTDTTVPVAVMITIDGQPVCTFWWFECLIWEWDPDLDARLLDPDGNVVATSECPAIGDCAGAGRQETLHVMPSATGFYTVEVYPYEGSPNDGKGGSFSVDLSTGPVGAGDAPPTVSLTEPADGATVSGTVSVAADATDDDAVTQVEFSYQAEGGSFVIGTDSDGTDGWSVSWDTSGLGDGSYTVAATATDTIGQTGTDSVSVTVDNVDDAPTVTITDPADESTVSGTVTVAADATDDDAVAQVEFFVDGASIGIDSDGSNGWSVSWDTTTATDGARTVSATATDTAGQTSSDSISATVDNTAPFVAISEPGEGATVSGTVVVSASVSDATPTSTGTGVTQVEFFVDGASIGIDSDGSNGWSVSWDTTTAENGSHTLTATAVDGAGNEGTSDPVTVTVENDASTIHIGDLDGSSVNDGPTWTAQVAVLVLDGAGNPVADAIVSGTWSDGTSGSASCTTGADGWCQVSQGGIAKRVKSVSFTVDDVTHASFTYDSSANTDPDGDSDGTSITVAKP